MPGDGTRRLASKGYIMSWTLLQCCSTAAEESPHGWSGISKTQSRILWIDNNQWHSHGEGEREGRTPHNPARDANPKTFI